MTPEEKTAAIGRNEARKMVAGLVANAALGLMGWAAVSIYNQAAGVFYPAWIAVGVALVMVSAAILRYIEPEE